MKRQRRRERLDPDMQDSPAAPLRFRLSFSKSEQSLLRLLLFIFYVVFFFCPKGVTLTDLQEAEKTMKTIKTDNKGREKKEDDEKEKEKESKVKKGEDGVRAIF